MANMTTFTGKKFDPFYMKEEDVSLIDIAHALSMICRGAGHIRYFYSVAQHSLNCCLEAEARGLSDRICLACLLHDASEAYISDIIRPVKSHLQQYYEIEDYIMEIVFSKFGLIDLTEEEIKYYKTIDDAILDNELKVLMPSEEHRLPKTLFSNPDFSEKDRRKVEIEFSKTVNKYLACL